MLKNPSIVGQLDLKQKAALMSGASTWQTYPIKDLVPSIFLSDGPHGLRKQAGAADHLGLNKSLPATCFPTAAALANSWNPLILKNVGQALGNEARALDVQQILGPGINIKRNPLAGRNFEFFSEDPYLAGKLGAAMIQGIQVTGTIATPKHFAANSQECRRMASNSIIDERTLREIYLTNFEIAVKEGHPHSIMSAYNLINGVYANENKSLLIDILRKEWGFDGYVVSDWGGDNNHIKGIQNGSNLAMPSLGVPGAMEIIKAVQNGQLSENVLDERVDELITVVKQSTAGKNQGRTIDWKADHDLARKAAQESIVLLKNDDDLLPLKETTKVALIGDFAKNPRYQGAGSSLVNAPHVENMLDQVNNFPVDFVGYADGYKRDGTADQKLLTGAVELANAADVAIVCIGLNEVSETEGLDRSTLRIPENQEKLLEALASAKAKIVVVISAGSVIEMPWLNKVAAVVHGYLGGEAGASAMWSVLTGQYNSSGRLAETYPMKYTDVPFGMDFPSKKRDVPYLESLFVGYRYYDTAKKHVRFPFGYGLSYTEFAYEQLQINQHGVQLRVKNIGQRPGRETVQLYVGKHDSPLMRPSKELKGFQQVELASGEAKTVIIPFDDKTFRYFDAQKHTWQVETGTYQIMIGADVEDIRLQGEYEIEQGVHPQVKPGNAMRKYKDCRLDLITPDDFAVLLGHDLPAAPFWQNHQLQATDIVAEMDQAHSGLARFAAHRLKKGIEKSQRAGKPNLDLLFNYNMPFRAMAKMTGGQIDNAMVGDILQIVNGHFWRGTGHLIADYRHNQQVIKQAQWYRPKIDTKEKSENEKSSNDQ